MTDSPHYDPNNLENCFAFVDAKRKLRIVLSSAEFQVGYTPLDLTFGGVAGREDNNRKDNNELVRLLRAQLAEAINLQNKDLIAQLHEAIRCVRMFDSDGLVNRTHILIQCTPFINAGHHMYLTRFGIM